MVNVDLGNVDLGLAIFIIILISIPIGLLAIAFYQETYKIQHVPFLWDANYSCTLSGNSQTITSPLYDINGSYMLKTEAQISGYNDPIYLLIYIAPKSSSLPILYPNVTVFLNGQETEKITLQNSTIYEPTDSPPVWSIYSGNVILYKIQPNIPITVVFPKNFTVVNGYINIWYIYMNGTYLFKIASTSVPISPYQNNNQVSIFP